MSRPLVILLLVIAAIVGVLVLLSTMAGEVPTTRIETPVTNAQQPQ